MRRWITGLSMLAAVTVVNGQPDPYVEGRSSMVKGDYSSAVVHLEKAAQSGKWVTEAYLNLGKSHFALGNFPAARDAFYEAEQRKQGIASLNLARTEIRLGRTELALKFLRDHLSSRYRVPESEILLDEDLSRLEGSAGWQALWREKEWYSPGEKQFQEARFLWQNGEGLEAINLLNDLEKQGFRRSEVQYQMAGIYRELGNERASLSALRKAVKSDIRNLDAVVDLASLRMEDGDPGEAVQNLNRVLRLEPDRFGVYKLRARAKSQSGDLRGAMEDLDFYLMLFPEDHHAIYQKGILQYAHGKYLDALQSFNTALEMDGGQAEYYFARGRTYASTGTLRYARKDLSMALDLDPVNGEVWYEMGQISEQLGEAERACRCYRTAFRHGVFEAQERMEGLCR